MAQSVVVDLFELTKAQKKAATLRGKDLLVTAGAGSGKTRTLVARYLSLLEDGYHPRQVVAITFTEKAAREMRNRVRYYLEMLRSEAGSTPEREFWTGLSTQMDSARIGTIHSLCAEILRTHPVEAVVDPEFEVIEEGLGAALRVQVVENALAWAVGEGEMQPLFERISPRGLAALCQYALDHRLEVNEWMRERNERGQEGEPGTNLPALVLLPIRIALEEFLNLPIVEESIAAFQEMQAEGTLESDAGENMSAQIQALLEGWDEVVAALERGELLQALQGFYDLRNRHMALNKGKRVSETKTLLKELRAKYDQFVRAWLTESPDSTLEEAYVSVLPLLRKLFDTAFQIFRAELNERQALDFDDLEYKALQLMREKASVREYWREQVQHLLVDEFQDTNQRQRELIELIAGDEPGRLFVVGDDRQSIYRFRGADVTVFRQMQTRIEERGGGTLLIDTTFRGHAELLDATSDLLEEAMESEVYPVPPYWVAFSPLEAYRKTARASMVAPHIEFLIGQGSDAASGRKSAALGLAERLLELRTDGQIESWEDVALLLRASTGFAAYEAAFEEVGIPYVTIAGRGFYDRPETRDVLNILRALADPWDDLAVAGMLRSPAFALPDAALYKLRYPNGNGGDPQALRQVLAGDLKMLDQVEWARARRAGDFLEELSPLADRLPVAELLKLVIDRTDYRSILATGSSRLWRNLDKLLEDAHRSRLVDVRTFLEYISTLREVGAREGEAPVESIGAVQLMTVHKAKGLEFNIVVLADASYRSPGSRGNAFLLPEYGLGVKLDRFEGSPLLFNYLKFIEKDQSEAEDKRLLYVATTRAREKLLVNGHIGGRGTSGWLKELSEIAGVDLKQLSDNPSKWERVRLPGGQYAGVWVMPEEASPTKVSPELDSAPVEGRDWHLGEGAALYLPLEEPVSVEISGAYLDEQVERPWRATGGRHAPSVVVGKMVHRAIQRWLFPGDSDLDALLRSVAWESGMVDEGQHQAAVGEALRLLGRFKDHSLWPEIDGAIQRYHEVPFAYTRKGKTDMGAVDLLYETTSGWVLVDFKTDELRDETELIAANEKYKPQLRRYRNATREFLGRLADTQICFLDYQGQVFVRKVS